MLNHQGQAGVTAEFYYTVKELRTTLILRQKYDEGRILTNSFHEASITLLPKPEREKEKRMLAIGQDAYKHG
jgi:hypothetical protein